MKLENRKDYKGPRTPEKPTQAAIASASALEKFKARVAAAMQSAMEKAVAVTADAGWTRTDMHHRFKQGR